MGGQMQQSNAAATALYDHPGGGTLHNAGPASDAGDAVMARWLQSAGLQHLASPLASTGIDHRLLPNLLMQVLFCCLYIAQFLYLSMLSEIYDFFLVDISPFSNLYLTVYYQFKNHFTLSIVSHFQGWNEVTWDGIRNANPQILVPSPVLIFALPFCFWISLYMVALILILFVNKLSPTDFLFHPFLFLKKPDNMFLKVHPKRPSGSVIVIICLAVSKVMFLHNFCVILLL